MIKRFSKIFYFFQPAIKICLLTGTSGSKRELTKLQNRIRELEASLEEEARRHNEAVKETRTNSRRLKELASESEDDKRRIIQLQEAVEALNKKLKAYRKQCEETEEIAALNLHKYRKAIQEQEDAMERADIAENNLNKMRCYNRSSVSMSRSSVPVRNALGRLGFLLVGLTIECFF